MTIERTQAGYIRCAEIVGTQMVYRVYVGATVAEAKRAFKQYLKERAKEESK